jgi:hypothetical protein
MKQGLGSVSRVKSAERAHELEAYTMPPDHRENFELV